MGLLTMSSVDQHKWYSGNDCACCHQKILLADKLCYFPFRDAQTAAEALNRVLNAVTQVLLKNVAVIMISEVAMEVLHQAKEEQQIRFRLAERKMRVMRARHYWNRSVGVDRLKIGWVGDTIANLLIACKCTVIVA